jgi:hypothetical protein
MQRTSRPRDHRASHPVAIDSAASVPRAALRACWRRASRRDDLPRSAGHGLRPTSDRAMQRTPIAMEPFPVAPRPPMKALAIGGASLRPLAHGPIESLASPSAARFAREIPGLRTSRAIFGARRGRPFAADSRAHAAAASQSVVGRVSLPRPTIVTRPTTALDALATPRPLGCRVRRDRSHALEMHTHRALHEIATANKTRCRNRS